MKRRKSLWIYAGIVGSFAAIPLVFFFAKRHFAKAEVEKKLAAFSGQGFPITLEELQASYACPEGENAAFLYADAFSKIVITNKQGETISDLLRQAARKASAGKIPLETLQAMDEVLAANQAALNLIREGNRIGNCRYPIDLRNIPGTSLPHLGGFKQACRLLHLEAEARLARSDAKGAYNSILNGFQLAQSLSKEPLLISHLLRCAGANIMLYALEQFLNQHPLTAEQIDELTQWLSANPAQIRTALSGELCMSLHYYRKGAIQTVIEWNAIQPINHRDWETPFGEMPLMLGAVWMDATSIWHEDCEFMLNALEKLFSSIELPAHRRQEFLALQSEKLRKIKEQSAAVFLLSEEFLPSIVKSLERELRFLASIRTAALSLAIERYRLASVNRGIPLSLGDLPAEILKTFGTNPYTGKRIQYFVLENGYRLLSAEPDGAFEASFTVER